MNKYCLECGNLFEVVNTGDISICGSCKGTNTQAKVNDKKILSFREKIKKHYQPQVEENFEEEKLIDINPGDIESSVQNDLKNINMPKSYQMFKAENVIASNPNEQYEKITRATHLKKDLDVEKLIQSAAVKKNIDIN